MFPSVLAYVGCRGPALASVGQRMLSWVCNGWGGPALACVAVVRCGGGDGGGLTRRNGWWWVPHHQSYLRGQVVSNWETGE